MIGDVHVVDLIDKKSNTSYVDILIKCQAVIAGPYPETILTESSHSDPSWQETIEISDKDNIRKQMSHLDNTCTETSHRREIFHTENSPSEAHVFRGNILIEQTPPQPPYPIDIDANPLSHSIIADSVSHIVSESCGRIDSPSQLVDTSINTSGV